MFIKIAIKKIIILIAFLGLSSFLSAQISTGLIGHWPCNGNATDVSGYNNNGTVHGAQLTTDRFGNQNSAYVFNGISDYIDCGVTSYSVPVAVSFWVKAYDNHSQWKTIFGWNQTTSNYNGIQFFLTPSCYLTARMGDANNEIASSSYICDSTSWNFILSTRIGNTQKLYVNGMFTDSMIIPVGIGGPDSLFFARSFRTPSYNEYFHGVIDDVRIYGRRLRDTEIDSLYNEPNITGISSYTNKQNFIFFPNPATNVIYVSEKTNIQITDLTGRILCEKKLATQVDISSYPSGIYFVLCLDNKGNIIYRNKLVKE